MTGEKEDLLCLSEIHQETQGIFLTLLVKSDENIIQDNGKRFNLLTK